MIRAYQDSWDHRCRLLFCCMGTSERNRNSFADIAKLLSDFFRELDVVPSDVVAGLVLLRKFQKLERQAIVRQVIITKCSVIVINHVPFSKFFIFFFFPLNRKRTEFMNF